MQTNPHPRTMYVYLYLFLGILAGLFLSGLASVIALLSTGTGLTLENLFLLHLNSLPFIFIDILAIIIAILFGFIGNQKDKTIYARSQLQRLSQRRNSDLQELNESMLSQDQRYKELEEIISRGKQQWEATFDAVNDLVILTDENGRILRCNQATGEAFQVGFSQLIGQQIDQLFLGEDADEGDLKNILVDKAEIHSQVLDGWYEISKSLVKVDNQQMGWVYVFRNISERKHSLQELQRLNQYYQLLVNNSPIAIVTLAQDNRIVECNPAFETLFGFTKKETIGWNLDSLIYPPDLKEELLALTETVQQGNTVHELSRRQRKDGSQVDVEIFGIPVVLGGKQIGSLALYHDISELVRLQRDAGPEVIAVEATWLSENDAEDSLDQAEAVLVVEPEAETVFIEEDAGEADSAVEAETPAILVDQEEETVEWVTEITDEGKKGPKPRAMPIEKIEGIGSVYSQKLADAGIKTTGDLLEFGKTRKGREDLVEKLEISPKLILKWVNMADLMRIKGVGEEYSELLEKAGVDTVRELRTRRPDHLHASLTSANEVHKLVRRLPHISEVESWVQEANELEPMITY